MSTYEKILLRGKLTKKFLMELPDGVYIASNCSYSIGYPVFEDKVDILSERHFQWEKIVKSGADQRLCYVFKTKSDYQKWLKEITAPYLDCRPSKTTDTKTPSESEAKKSGRSISEPKRFNFEEVFIKLQQIKNILDSMQIEKPERGTQPIQLEGAKEGFYRTEDNPQRDLKGDQLVAWKAYFLCQEIFSSILGEIDSPLWELLPSDLPENS
jgi:hypothetical protein